MNKDQALITDGPSRGSAVDAAPAVLGDLKGIKNLLQEIKARAAAREEHYTKLQRELDLAQERFRAEREIWENMALAQTQALAKREEELARLADDLAAESDKRRSELARLADDLAADSDKCKAELARLADDPAAREELDLKRELELNFAQEQFRAEREAWQTTRHAETQALAKSKEEIARLADDLAAEYDKSKKEIARLADDLAAEYRKKQLELQGIKQSLQSELAEVVSQYQAGARGSGA